MKQVRLDVCKIDSHSLMTNGFLKAEAYLTRCGVFNYYDDNGNLVRELRHPDDVFEEASMATLRGLVVTNDHPPEMVNADNCKKYSSGFTSDFLNVDDGKIKSVVTLTDKITIRQVVDNEKRDMSCGYTCDILAESGEWLGAAYDVRQKNIRYNHVSVVKMGRAGSEIGIRIDSAQEKIAIAFIDPQDSACVAKIKCLPLKQDSKFGDQTMTAKIKIDAVEYETTEGLAKVVVEKLDALSTITQDAAKFKIESEKEKGRADALQSEIEKRDAEIKDLKDKELDDTAILARADALSKVREFAKKILGADKIDGLTIADLKSKVVEKLTKVEVAKKDSAYIDVSFETLMATHKEVKTDKMQEALADSMKDGTKPTQTWQEKRDAAVQQRIVESRK